ncbi:MAG: hypothetical protein HN548_00305 [Opitutae bacterium]|jgi:hypothetical protein|nr:hypothetical protein [Opitutae bacterium]MBT5715928.1 hypothetical protein [Opitutae bacterium]
MKKRIITPPPFNDFLGLEKINFGNARLLIFHGISGSGKSSNLNYFAYHHSSTTRDSVKWIWTQHKRFDVSSIKGHDLVIVDEIISPIQLPAIFKLLRANKRVAIASHLNPVWFKIFCHSTPSLFFRTDASSKKIRDYLDDKCIPYSPESIISFCKTYGSNYVDLQCILESYPGKNFDDALKWNQKFNQITSFVPKNWIPSIPKLKFD